MPQQFADQDEAHPRFETSPNRVIRSQDVLRNLQDLASRAIMDFLPEWVQNLFNQQG
jgi:hypothetical protein